MNSPIILPLDGINDSKAIELVTELKDHIWGVKFNDLLDVHGISIIKRFKNLGIKVFADPKLHDIPNTVANRIKHYVDAGADFITVHASGGITMMEAAKENAGDSKILAVTILTSISGPDCEKLFGDEVPYMVKSLALDAVRAKVDGIVCSPQEVDFIAKDLNLFKVIPGIRPEWYQTADDQNRVATPKQAMERGADYLVIGRPILKAENKLEAVKKTLEEIKESVHDW